MSAQAQIKVGGVELRRINAGFGNCERVAPGRGIASGGGGDSACVASNGAIDVLPVPSLLCLRPDVVRVDVVFAEAACIL